MYFFVCTDCNSFHVVVVVDFQWDIRILLLIDKLIQKVLSCNAQQEPFMVCFAIILVLQSPPPSPRHDSLQCHPVVDSDSGQHRSADRNEPLTGFISCVVCGQLSSGLVVPFGR